jgi:uncharacterized protein (UPF0332 family)
MVDYDQLLELAETETQSAAGAPRQAYLRRAVSTAYYAVFHALLTRVATTFVKTGFRKSQALFYRSLEHKTAKTRCIKSGKARLDISEKDFFGFDSFPGEIRNFANEFVRLQELRHACDYDPDFRIAKARVVAAIAKAREAIDNLRVAQENNDEATTLFLSYLLFGLRS